MRKDFAQQACIVVPGKLCKLVSMLKLLIVIDLLCTLPSISIVTHRALDFLTYSTLLLLFCLVPGAAIDSAERVGGLHELPPPRNPVSPPKREAL